MRFYSLNHLALLAGVFSASSGPAFASRKTSYQSIATRADLSGHLCCSQNDGSNPLCGGNVPSGGAGPYCTAQEENIVLAITCGEVPPSCSGSTGSDGSCTIFTFGVDAPPPIAICA